MVSWVSCRPALKLLVGGSLSLLLVLLSLERYGGPLWRAAEPQGSPGVGQQPHGRAALGIFDVLAQPALDAKSGPVMSTLDSGLSKLRSEGAAQGAARTPGGFFPASVAGSLVPATSSGSAVSAHLSSVSGSEVPPPPASATVSTRALHSTSSGSTTALPRNSTLTPLIDRLRLSLSSSTGPKLVACTLVRDMLKSAHEWVAFHLLQGFSHFALYDDSPTDETRMHAHEFGALAEFITIHHRNTLTEPKESPKPQAMGGRQWKAFRRCIAEHAGENTFVAIFDVDEFLWSCDPSYKFIDIVAGFDVVETQFNACPRFAAVDRYDDQIPVISQLFRRSPVWALGEPESKVRQSLPECTSLTTVEARGNCFGATAEKSIYNMKIMEPWLFDQISIHGIRGSADQNRTKMRATTNRTHGLCCNHYFVRDLHEAEWKANFNRNDFYSNYLTSPQIRQFYTWTRDTIVHDMFGRTVVSLLQEAGLPFKSSTTTNVEAAHADATTASGPPVSTN